MNTTYNPANFVLNYGGSNNINLTGGNMSFAVINAPNADILRFQVARTSMGRRLETDHEYRRHVILFDSNLSTPVPTVNNSPYRVISMRELSY